MKKGGCFIYVLFQNLCFCASLSLQAQYYTTVLKVQDLFFFLGLFFKFFQQYWYMHLKMSTLFTTKTSIKISLFRTSGFAKLNKLKETLHKQQLPFLLRITTVPQKLCVFLSTDSDEIFYYLVKFFQLKIASQSRHKHMLKSMGSNIQNPFAYENQNS